jgi:hypothetical protein
MRFARLFAVAAIGIVGPISAQADTLNLSLTADNAFAVYLSTSDNVLGTLIGTNVGGPAGQWSGSVSLSSSLSAPTSPYYIHVIGTNYTLASGTWPTPGTPNGTGSNPNAFLGQFSITGTDGYKFANGTTSLLTNATDWRAIAATDNVSWTQPLANAQAIGANGIGPWGNVSGISSIAQWIWSNPDNTLFADFSTTIALADENVAPTPLPGALPLFVAGLGMMGALGWRRKRRTLA